MREGVALSRDGWEGVAMSRDGWEGVVMSTEQRWMGREAGRSRDEGMRE